jgi:hypothetical protein
MSQKSSVQLTPSNVPQLLTADKPAISERLYRQNEILRNAQNRISGQAPARPWVGAEGSNSKLLIKII